ncbi:MAG: PAS domain S-box protein [Hyphomonas sp.]|nr:PAS domain S-box protein [Hyphomonas sp.]
MADESLAAWFQDNGTIVGLIADFLDKALDSVSEERPLDDVSLPLVGAIEAIPGAGRVAILSADRRRQLRVVAAPAFSNTERDRLRAALQPHLSDPSTIPLRIENLLDNGSGLHLDLRGFALSAPNENPVAFIVTVRTADDAGGDDTFLQFMDQVVRLAGLVVEDLRLRSAFSRQRDVLEAIALKAPDAIVRIDRTGQILDFIGAAPAMFGYTQNELRGRHVSALMPEPHASRHDDYVDTYMTTGERKLPDFGRRVEARRSDGTLFPVEIALSRLGNDPEPEFLGIIRDVSNTVERENSLSELRQALEYSNRRSVMGEMASTIAHELNQPLTAISNYLDSLVLHLQRQEAEPDPFVLELIGKARQQSRLGSEIIRRMRLLYQQEPAHTETGDFHAAVADAADFIRPVLEKDGITLTVHQEGTNGRADFDRVQLLQVMTNIASNARRALEGTESPRIDISSTVSDDTLVLTISDNGPGIPDGNKIRIFDSFFTTDERGSGLGLAVVRRIARAHGGQISASDTPGGGATFELVLPRHADESGGGNAND